MLYTFSWEIIFYDVIKLKIIQYGFSQQSAGKVKYGIDLRYAYRYII